MAYHVYILYSQTLDRHYVGSTEYAPLQRLAQHNEQHYSNAYTSRGIPWELFYSFECVSKAQAMAIEKHIKKMKSRKYLQNLRQYPKITERLCKKYPI